MVSLTEPDDDHLSIRKTKINICRKIFFFQKTNPIGKLLDVLACTWGGPSP